MLARRLRNCSWVRPFGEVSLAVDQEPIKDYAHMCRRPRPVMEGAEKDNVLAVGDPRRSGAGEGVVAFIAAFTVADFPGHERVCRHHHDVQRAARLVSGGDEGIDGPGLCRGRLTLTVGAVRAVIPRTLARRSDPAARAGLSHTRRPLQEPRAIRQSVRHWSFLLLLRDWTRGSGSSRQEQK